MIDCRRGKVVSCCTLTTDHNRVRKNFLKNVSFLKVSKLGKMNRRPWLTLLQDLENVIMVTAENCKVLKAIFTCMYDTSWHD